MKATTYTLAVMLALLIAACISQAFSYNVTKINSRDDAIVVDGKTVHIYRNFQKPTPCDTIEYDVTKEGNVLSVQAGPGTPYDGMCIQMIATETVDIMMTLEKGRYTINFYDYWSAGKENKKPVTETFEVN